MMLTMQNVEVSINALHFVIPFFKIIDGWEARQVTGEKLNQLVIKQFLHRHRTNFH
jgi:hypothetical protein